MVNTVQSLPPKKVLIIGAGPGGLVTLKTLLDASKRYPSRPLDPLLVEAEDDIGGTFRWRAYEVSRLPSLLPRSFKVGSDGQFMSECGASLVKTAYCFLGLPHPAFVKGSSWRPYLARTSTSDAAVYMTAICG